MTYARRPTIATGALGLAGCLLLAACGNGTTAADSTAPSAAKGSAGPTSAAATDPPSTDAATASAVAEGSAQACTLVTQQEAGTALGKDPGPGSKFSSHGSSQCQYGNMGTGLVLVNLTPTRGKAAYDLMHSNPKVGHPVDAPGVGDRAFEITGPNTASVYFDKGDALVVVMVSIRSATSPPESQVLALAKTAADRI